MMSGRCVVNVATGIYARGQDRLKQSLIKNGYTGDFLFFRDELPPGCPSHEQAPWAFKICAVQEAIKKGYSSILWLDTNMMCIRNPDVLFQKMEKTGYYVFCAGTTYFGQWCSDAALENFHLTREKSLRIWEIGPSCIGFSTHSRTAMDFCRDWADFAADGITFRGIPQNISIEETNSNSSFLISKDNRVFGHRHDQTAASYLAWKYRMYLSMLEIKNYAFIKPDGKTEYAKTIPFDVIFLQNRDIKTPDYLLSADKYGNSRGLRRVLFVFLSFCATVKNRKKYRNFLKTLGGDYYT